MDDFDDDDSPIATLPQSRPMPSSITEDKLPSGLAGLAKTPGLQKLADVVISQWSRGDVLDRLGRYGIYPIRKVLMYGPPGNGKTMACHWLAAELGVPLYRVRCEQLIASLLGETALKVRKALDWISGCGKAIILFDEVETIFPSRALNDSANEGCKREISAAMAVMWQMLDRWSSPQLFCFATNMENRLDPALMSRFELQLHFAPPTRENIVNVLDYWREVFHDLGADVWYPELVERDYESFRQLWLSIADRVRSFALQ